MTPSLNSQNGSSPETHENMKPYHREKLTLDDAMMFAGIEWVEDRSIMHRHVRFDPKLEHDYRRIERARHDGTLLFSIELLQKALSPLFDCTSYYRRNGPCPDGHVSVYTVGYIRRAIVFGTIELPDAGRIRGQRESIIIPVKCEYIKFEDFLGLEKTSAISH